MGQETAKLPFAEESARGTADGNADGRGCFPAGAPKDLQKLYELLRRWRRKMSAGTCHELRKFARDSQVAAQVSEVADRCASSRVQAAVEARANCRRIVVTSAGCCAVA